MNTTCQETVSIVVRPGDSWCQWWAIKLPDDLSSEHLTKHLNAPVLRRESELELAEEDMVMMVIESEAAEVRRYDVLLYVCVGGKIHRIQPGRRQKTHIKARGGQHLMKGVGDVAACRRCALWLREQPDLGAALQALIDA